MRDFWIIFEASQTEESVLDHVFFHLDGQLAVFEGFFEISLVNLVKGLEAAMIQVVNIEFIFFIWSVAYVLSCGILLTNCSVAYVEPRIKQLSRYSTLIIVLRSEQIISSLARLGSYCSHKGIPLLIRGAILIWATHQYLRIVKSCNRFFTF